MAQKQISVSMPKEWFDQLEQLASSYTERSDRPRSMFETIRNSAKEIYLRFVNPSRRG